MFRSHIAATAALMITTAPALAATTYSQKADFYSAIGTPGAFVDFETATQGQNFNGATVFGMTITAPDGAEAECATGGISDSNPVGACSLEVATSGSPELTLTFATAINYFGFLYIDAGSPNISANGNFLRALPDTLPDGDSARFAGFTFDTAVTSITFTSVGGDTTWGVDDIAFGQLATVPVPAAGLLLLAGLGALGATRRRAARG